MRLLSLSQAQDRVLAAMRPLRSERVSMALSVGRFLRERVRASIPLPPCDNSSMDGFAARSRDVSNASKDHPARLRLLGYAGAGDQWRGRIRAGTCLRVSTGSRIPAGADCVVKLEDTRPEAACEGWILFSRPVVPGEHVRFRGEEALRGECLLEPGTRLTASRVALLAAVGRRVVRVGCQPRLALIATGNELIEPGSPLGAGRVYESNRLALAALASAAGGCPSTLPLQPDLVENTRDALERALHEFDLVVTIGGVSVGQRDFIREAFTALGGRLRFWGVAIRPGKPFAFGQWRDRFLFGLPGNPVSAFVCFLLFVRPALLRLQGAADCLLPTQSAILGEPLANDGDRPHFVRVSIRKNTARLAGMQASHGIKALAAADGLVEVPPRSVLEARKSVSVMTWD